MPRHGPRRLRFALERYELHRKRVLDLGCGPGTYLRHFGPGSVGLDLNPHNAPDELDVRRWDFTDPIPDDLGTFDAVWCSNFLEHVLAPHSFLIECRRPSADGLLIITVPQTTAASWGPWWGHLAVDHINFFTPRTLRLTLERAGYEVDFLGNPSLPLRLRVGPTLMAACRPIPDFQYPEKAHKRLEASQIVFKD